MKTYAGLKKLGIVGGLLLASATTGFGQDVKEIMKYQTADGSKYCVVFNFPVRTNNGVSGRTKEISCHDRSSKSIWTAREKDGKIESFGYGELGDDGIGYFNEVIKVFSEKIFAQMKRVEERGEHYDFSYVKDTNDDAKKASERLDALESDVIKPENLKPDDGDK